MKKTLALTMVLCLALSACNLNPFSGSQASLDDGQNQVDETGGSTEEAPLFITTMTHMEGNHGDDELEMVFTNHIAQLEYGMDMADEYGAILTIESEQPFARANTLWDRNFMQEILDRGHGVGTHCDIGARDKMSVSEMTAQLKENKALVDDLVGAENNRGCSGAGSATDWVQAAQNAGFDYIDGIVGLHMLSIENPPTGWEDAKAIMAGSFHDNVPTELMERIYFMKLKDNKDFEHDEDGELVISNGELGALDRLAEGGDYEACNNGSQAYEECVLSFEDVEALVEIIEEVDAERDRSQVAKLSVYMAAHVFDEDNEEVLRYFFSEMERLSEEGKVEWASQWDAVKTYLDWEAGDYEAPEEEPTAEKSGDPIKYVTFTMNTHDWVNEKESAETIQNIIDLHDEYEVPVDIYMTDPVFQNYMDDYPELIESLKDSEWADLSYHVRPPHPYNADFDTIGLADMDKEELLETIELYETHALDLETGDVLDHNGGFLYMKAVMGYAPVVTGIKENTNLIETTLSEFYAENGAQLTISRDDSHIVGATFGDLYVRPEHYDLKLYEKVREDMTAEEILDEAYEGIEHMNDEAVFIGIKYHENNFYLTGTPFWPTYWESDNHKDVASPPYDLSASLGVKKRGMSEREEHWALYEMVLQYVAENSGEWVPIQAVDMVDMLD